LALAALLPVAGVARAADAPAPPAPPASVPQPVQPLPPAAAAAPTGAPAENDMQANRALGHRLFRLGRYEEAVAAFRRAYEVKADARLLYDIAECYREVGAVDQALFYYDRYLAAWPEAFDRDQVEKTVAALSAGRSPAPAAARKRPLMISDDAAKPRPAPRPWQRWWFWTAIGVALAAGATAVALSSGPDSGPPASDLGSKRFY
jgi:tetratricopeptide (TPR) repeat protein